MGRDRRGGQSEFQAQASPDVLGKQLGEESDSGGRDLSHDLAVYLQRLPSVFYGAVRSQAEKFLKPFSKLLGLPCWCQPSPSTSL